MSIARVANNAERSMRPLSSETSIWVCVDKIRFEPEISAQSLCVSVAVRSSFPGAKHLPIDSEMLSRDDFRVITLPHQLGSV